MTLLVIAQLGWHQNPKISVFGHAPNNIPSLGQGCASAKEDSGAMFLAYRAHRTHHISNKEVFLNKARIKGQLV